ncbi:phosphonate ABC transporter, permease protein PhnE [Rhodovulum sp. DZ06]|uniref:phosphonate ABC transporter, permease protein PhnE n=1 Tax=Rhodovulum sp. DZ06 TaxID=3425126 RepID=UPI003D34F7C5
MADADDRTGARTAALTHAALDLARRRRLYTLFGALLILAVLVSGYDVSNEMNSGGFLSGLPLFFDYPAALLAEAWEKRAGFPGLLVRFLPALLETLNIALTATLLGGAAAVALSLAATRGLGAPGWLVSATRRTMDVMRAFPELILALFLIYVLGGSPVPAMIAVAFHTAGALGKLFAEVNENAAQGPLEGLSAGGASWLQRIRFGLLPQAAPNWLSYFLLRLEINVRASAILGFVGAGGIGTELRRTIGWGKGSGDETMALFVLLLASIFVIDQFSSWARGRLTRGAGDEVGAGPDAARGRIRRRSLLTIGFPALALVYLGYAWVAFDVPGLIEKSRPERAAILASDAVSYKTHVTADLRRGGIEVAVEGERLATYDPAALPVWAQVDGNVAQADLGNGVRARIDGKTLALFVPGYGEITATASAAGVETVLPAGPVPDWLIVRGNKLDARTPMGPRAQVSRAKIELHRFHFGWEHFWFDFRSPLQGLGWGELAALALSADRIEPGMSNAWFMVQEFLGNQEWQHRAVFVAVFETLMMAVLGTLTAAFVALPLAALAARNFSPSGTVRFAVRRLFDLLRGIDMLIWSLIFIRAFGLGPLTGALAIAFTDTGTLGKLFSEALENVDEKQIEGVHAAGATRLQKWRYGVLPQIAPVFVSQGLYYLESNVRSATVIGALGAGGIGLMLVETMRTSRDWENTAWIVALTIALVSVMDAVSTRLRRRLIDGGAEKAAARGAKAAAGPLPAPAAA